MRMVGSGRQTQNPERGRKLDCANWLGADPGGRQTQNPERGRKLHIDFLDLARREDHVVRPKTPRGDGNPATIAPARADDSGRQTQNPERGRKPHGPGRAADGPGGRQTQNPERGRKLDCANWLGADPGGRQTQNPERGRKLHIDFLDLARREDHVVRPKTPREDGNSSTIASMSMSQSSSRQTQNPERGRKLGACHRRRHD
ncbi:Uncharacterised protein [Mycobacterium tuberculosis]|nr:Uncharacterised protein [Mycobacterium tuberculosis]